jgi:hypothetical protein
MSRHIPPFQLWVQNRCCATGHIERLKFPICIWSHWEVLVCFLPYTVTSTDWYVYVTATYGWWGPWHEGWNRLNRMLTLPPAPHLPIARITCHASYLGIYCWGCKTQNPYTPTVLEASTLQLFKINSLQFNCFLNLHWIMFWEGI